MLGENICLHIQFFIKYFYYYNVYFNIIQLFKYTLDLVT